MSLLVPFVHAVIVFGVPILFGWVVLRRLVRENDLLILVPGSFVVGIAAHMSGLNELRHYMEMNVALWTFYKLLLAATLSIVVFSQKPRSPPTVIRTMRSAWRLLLVGGGAVVSSVYFGIPAFKGVLNDAWWGHYPAAIEIQTIARFPLHHFLALDDPLYYHYGPDLVAASWAFLLDLSVQQAYALLITTLAPAAFLLGVGLVARFSKRFWSGLLAGVFAIVGGNLCFLYMAQGEFAHPLTFLKALNSQTMQGFNQMVFTPSHAVGMPLTLAIIAIFRHFIARFTLSLAAILGLTLATLSLVAEWYFFPLVAALTIVSLIEVWERFGVKRERLLQFSLRLLPIVIALSWAIFNNSYIAGTFGKYWMRYGTFSEQASRRLSMSLLRAQPSSVELEVLPPLEKSPPSRLTSLTPLLLNLSHLGSVPTWESAGANENPYISMLSSRFLAECIPVVIIGLPLGLLRAWRRHKRIALVIGLAGLISAAPPILLDWDYRSVDFLRFFTGTFICSAILLGWLVGEWLFSQKKAVRCLGWAVAVCALINPVALGWIGLMPSTLETVKAVSFSGASLADTVKKQASPTTAQTSAAPAVSVPTPTSAQDTPQLRNAVYETLATRAGLFLLPITHGEQRAIVLVSENELPPLKTFPEWMKFTTLARTPVPIGWYWEASSYADYYRKAVRTLSRESLIALGAQWIVVTNIFDHKLPPDVLDALKDRTRFIPVSTSIEGRYFLTLYRVVE